MMSAEPVRTRCPATWTASLSIYFCPQLQIPKETQTLLSHGEGDVVNERGCDSCSILEVDFCVSVQSEWVLLAFGDMALN
jgi:hypothetical protein